MALSILGTMNAAARRVLAAATLAGAGFTVSGVFGAADAQDLPVEGQPVDGAVGFQPPASPVMTDIENFHNHLLLPIITVVSVVVLLLMLWVMIRYNARANKTPRKFTHNTLVEVIWTVIPVAILVVIAVPSFKLLYKEDVLPKIDLTIKATGNQWFWSYEYPDNGDFSYDSILVPEADLKPGQLRLLSVDNPLVVPVDKNIRVIVTAADVIHAFAVPAFGFKIDAVPGRLNEIWFKAEKPGIYYGQCSELCGKDHAFMPIEVHVLPQDQYDLWVAQKQQAAGIAPTPAAANPAETPAAEPAAPAPAAPATGGAATSTNTR